MARLLIPVFLCLGAALVQAAPFQDPTRPAPAFLPSTAASTPAVTPLVLQSILLGPQRRIAIINGQRLEIGQKIRGLELIALTSTQAILQGPQGRITLHLLPGASRRQIPGDFQ